jgi:hypothetical protein|tara:strand:+ start:7 stop:543 length:537 start_codon:yes stop_codon:yes gene_type:complete
MWRETETGNIIQGNQSWIDRNGLTHPDNWQIWTSDYKKSMGLEELTPDPTPNDITWSWTRDEAGKVTKTARNLADQNVTIDGVSTVRLGVKSTLINEVKSQQRSLMERTDWAVTRKSEVGTDIPTNIATWRSAIRTKGTAMEDAIDGAVDTSAVEALLLTWDSEGNKSGILYDWPELV